MGKLTLPIIVASLLSISAATAAELDIYPPVDVPAEWHRLADQYQSQIDKLKDERRTLGEKAKTLEDELNAIDFAKETEQSEQNRDEAQRDMAESLGDAFTEYFEGPGKPEHVLGAGVTIITETLPAYADLLEATYAPVDLVYKMDEMQSDIARYQREMADFDKKIADLQRNADLSNKIAELYALEINATRTQSKDIVFKLVETTKAAVQAAQEKHDTVPPGWAQCTCPDAHAGLGRIINGVRYHPQGYTCPPS